MIYFKRIEFGTITLDTNKVNDTLTPWLGLFLSIPIYIYKGDSPLNYSYLFFLFYPYINI